MEGDDEGREGRGWTALCLSCISMVFQGLGHGVRSIHIGNFGLERREAGDGKKIGGVSLLIGL